jgi:hypothetical protein
MAKVTGTTETGFLVELSPVEAKRVFAEKTITPGLEKNINVVYNQLTWLVNNKVRLRAFIDEMRNSADNLEAAVNTAGV